MQNPAGKNNRISKGRGRKNAGFSLLEILAGLAIMVILFSVAATGVGDLYRNVTQTKLDKTAEQVYIAAQNQMVSVYAAGDSRKLKENGIPMTTAPSDWDTEEYGTYSNGEGTPALRYVTSFLPGTASDTLLPIQAVSREVRENRWLIEYNPFNGFIYGVFYSETAAGLDELHMDSLRAGRAQRLQYYENGNHAVGYYGGGVQGDGMHSVTPEVLPFEQLAVELNVTNAEELKTAITATIPGGVSFCMQIELIGSNGSLCRTIDNDLTMLTAGEDSQYKLELVLDSLKNGNSFCNLNDRGWDTIGGGVQPGENIRVKVTLDGEQTLGGITEQLDTVTASTETNSLFADYRDTVAYVAYGRHLQNLNTGTSRVGVMIQEGSQIQNIDFGKSSEWQKVYGERAFVAIKNNDITAYSGNRNVLRDMYIIGNSNDNGNAGLFSGIGTAGATVNLNFVRMENTIVQGNGNAGTLAGYSLGGVTNLNFCEVYWKDVPLDANPMMAQWIQGGTDVGGLIGHVTGEAKVSNSFTATTIGGNGKTGGFFGQAGRISVNGSYANNYLTGAEVGGFAAICESGSSFERCYVTGFVMNSGNHPVMVNSVAGFAPAENAVVKNAYSALDAQRYMQSHSINSNNAFALVKSGSMSDAYTLMELSGNMQHQELQGETVVTDETLQSISISGMQNSAPANAVPYQIGTNRYLPDSYPYPTLKNLTHYNDWATDLVKGYRVTLVSERAHVDGEVFRVMDADRVLQHSENDMAYSSIPTTVDGWKLEGWYSSNSGDGGTKYIDADGTILHAIDSDNLVLYAKWSKHNVLKKTDTFCADGVVIVVHHSNEYYLIAVNGNDVVSRNGLLRSGYTKDGLEIVQILSNDDLSQYLWKGTDYLINAKNGRYLGVNIWGTLETTAAKNESWSYNSRNEKLTASGHGNAIPQKNILGNYFTMSNSNTGKIVLYTEGTVYEFA